MLNWLRLLDIRTLLICQKRPSFILILNNLNKKKIRNTLIYSALLLAGNVCRSSQIVAWLSRRDEGSGCNAAFGNPHQ